MDPLDIEIEFKQFFGMTIAQAYKRLEDKKKASEDKFQAALVRATNHK